MGDFSRNPKDRLADSVSKHYVGVRMQQGVPILDTDWNELEDLRRHELQELSSQFIGDGVPGGNDGFRIQALAGGGIGAIVLIAKNIVNGHSSIEIDLNNSTAASTLGFFPGKSFSERYGSSPSRLTGNASGLFSLSDGMTLTVKTNGEAGETITFSSGDFTDISQATAIEVISVLSALAEANVEVSTGNDFIICGGDGTTEKAGRLLVSGQEILNENDLEFTSQPLYQNQELADQWGVDVISAIDELPSSDRPDMVYIDVWDREINSEEDDDFMLAQVGIETTVRLKREWAIRVAQNATDLSGITRVPGHKYLALARLDRKSDDGNRIIPEKSIIDLRKRRLTLSDTVISPIHVKGELGIDWVNSGLFVNMLRSTSTVYNALLESDYFLADNFSSLTAVESVKILRCFQDVRMLAESGITDASLERLDNDAALDYLRRLYNAQRDFVDSMLELTAGNSARAGTELLLNDLDTWLEGNGSDIPGLRQSVMSGESPNLGNAYDAQIFINDEIGRQTGILPVGSLDIQVVDGPTAVINPGLSYEFIYSIRSELNVDETIELALSDTQGVFKFEFKSLGENPAYPGDKSKAILLMEKETTVNIAFNLIVPSVLTPGTSSRIFLNAKSQLNPDDIDFSNLEILVTVGDVVDLPAPELLLAVTTPDVSDVVPIGKTSDGKHVSFELEIRYLVESTITNEFQFSVDFIGNPSSFEVLGAGTLVPFDLSGSIQPDDSIFPTPATIPIGATASAVNGQESLMIIRLFKTGDTSFFREMPIYIITEIS